MCAACDRPHPTAHDLLLLAMNGTRQHVGTHEVVSSTNILCRCALVKPQTPRTCTGIKAGQKAGHEDFWQPNACVGRPGQRSAAWSLVLAGANFPGQVPYVPISP